MTFVQAIAIIHVLLDNKLVQEAATPTTTSPSKSSTNLPTTTLSCTGNAPLPGPTGSNASSSDRILAPSAVAESTSGSGTVPGHGSGNDSISGGAGSTAQQKSAVSDARCSSSRLAKNEPKKSFLRTVLVLVPKNVLRNWEEELNKVVCMGGHSFALSLSKWH